MAGIPKCHVCGWRYAKAALGNVCTPCYDKHNRYDNEDDKSPYDAYKGYIYDRPLIPDRFGVIKNKFGVER